MQDTIHTQRFSPTSTYLTDLKAGYLDIGDAITQTALAEERVLVLIGLWLIGRGHASPGTAALELGSAAGITHDDLAGELTPTQRLTVLCACQEI